jgi:2-polyprenyl-3-methyl-5-hydroxy-6-metoxy-1,4-benzoquinol methylase
MISNSISQCTDDDLMEKLIVATPVTRKAAEKSEVVKNLIRHRRVFEAIPPGEGTKRLLDVGARLYSSGIYANDLDYREVALGVKWSSDFNSEELRRSIPSHERISVYKFDAEQDEFPFEDQHFDTVICSEVLEHLAIDPMHMLAEINRVTKTDGLLVLSTPNAASFFAMYRIMSGNHPYSWSPYNGASTDRHNREYTIDELEKVVLAGGFDVVSSETFSQQSLSVKNRFLATWISLPWLLRGKRGLDIARMGNTSLVIGKKAGNPKDRRPSWLYYDPFA